MLETILNYMNSVEPHWIYLILFAVAFTENIFPPSPSDVVVIIGASLIANSTTISYLPVLLITSLGSAAGFIVMYYLGYYLSEHVLRSGKFKFIKKETLARLDVWFKKYGYKIIIANRFLPGTRAVVSFFAGVSELKAWKTFILASIGAFIWNAMIIFIGMQLGNNIELIDNYLKTYSKVGLLITLLIILYFVIRKIIKLGKATANETKNL
ncbi:MAG: DedA family protein [bacterium]